MRWRVERARRAGAGGLLNAQLRSRGRSATALGLGVMVATSAFTVLTTGSEVERLELRGDATQAESGYHVVVRAAGSRSDLEAEHGLVRPFQLSGRYGGITLADQEAIRSLPGVEAAAPVAMVGYVMSVATMSVEAGAPPASLGRELLVADVVHTADRGLTTIDQPAASYTYLTSHPTTIVGEPGDEDGAYGLAEHLPDGSARLVCPVTQGGDVTPAGRAGAERLRSRACGSTAPGSDAVGPGTGPQERTVAIEWTFPVLVAAVDVGQEAALVRDEPLPRALRSLDDADPAGRAGRPVPVVLSERSGIDAQAEVTVRRARPDTVVRFAAGLDTDEVGELLTASGGDVVGRQTITADDAYARLVEEARRGQESVVVDSFWTTGHTTYGAGDGVLAPRPVDHDDDVWRSALRAGGYVPAPAVVADTGFRELQAHQGSASGVGPQQLPRLDVIDVFDSAELDAAEFAGADGLPAADARTRELLAGRTLRPSGSPSAYQLGPPTAFMRLSDLDAFTGAGIELTDADAPISAIRVRVADVTGVGALDRERVRAVADRIHATTGLDVDVVLGSSPAPQTVRLPPGEFGRPSLTLTETWVRKGVVLVADQAIDRKSVVLFVLVLGVCGLYVANVTAAAARSGRADLAVLSRVGWRRGRILRLLLAEVGTVGLVAGLAGAVVSLAIGVSAGLNVTVSRSLLAVPAAVGVALVAAAWPAWRASRPPIVPTGHRSTGPAVRLAPWVRSLAVANVLRSPGRSAVGMLAVAVGCAAMTVLLGVMLAFDGSVVGSVLGDVVFVRTRGVDYAAASVVVVLAAVGVADVVFLNIRDRRAEFAVLRAVGWTDGRVRRLILAEAGLIGLVGAVAGTGFGLSVTFVITKELPVALLLVAGVTVTVGVVTPVLASVVPAGTLRRSVTAYTLARDA